jgi:type IV pilus assembly protein PilN
VIRTNLSTRPFYNERAVHIGLIVLAVIVLLATAYNVSRILRYSSSDTRLATQASRDEARAADLRQEAARLRASVDPHQVELASAGARQANDLIDRRTFSWTELLNRFEKTLPDEVRISSVSPRLDRDKGIMLLVHVKARGVDDVQEFMENLEATGAFKDAEPVQDRLDDEGQWETTLDMAYIPEAAKPAAAQTPEEKPAAAPAGRGAAPEEPPVPTGARGRGGATRP